MILMGLYLLPICKNMIFLKLSASKNKAQFWRQNNELIEKHEASNILCYMKLMLDKARAAGVSVQRQKFVDFGKSIELYEGVEEWFDLINQLGQEEGVIIQHYINSSGLKEMIEGTKIGNKFQEIYACTFMYEDGVAVWPAVAVDFTTKTQFLFMINKGVTKISENAKINEYKAEEDRPIPFKHMIYFGDGETDIPCMKLIKQQGGNSIAVYKPRNKKKKACAEKLVLDDRVNFACAANYVKDGEIYNIVKAIIKQIKSNFNFNELQKQNVKRFGVE